MLGLVIALQSWRHSRLALARNLKWLAAFGLLHGLHEWGHVFIPLQALYLAQPFIDLLIGLQVVLLAISFACLFQFGVETLRPLPSKYLAVRYVPGAVLALWAFIALGPTLSVLPDARQWATLNTISARYMLGFCGALLAAYGLRQQAQHLIAPLEMPRIWRMLQVAGLTLAVYAIMGGLIVSPANFFPANWLNTTNLEQFTFIPVEVYRSILGLILIWAIWQAIDVFQLELDRQLAGMEEAQMLIAERERIGRDLHDGTLQTIYAAGLLLKTTQKDLANQTDSANVSARIEQTVGVLDEAVTQIRSHIGDLRDTADQRSLLVGLQDLASTHPLRSLLEVELALKLPEQCYMTPTRIGHLLAIANEGLSNVARHAHASHVLISAAGRDNRLVLSIADNGRGFPADYVTGYGLRNMQERARMLGGEMQLETVPGDGTTITIEIPWRDSDG